MPDLREGHFELPDEESRHAIKVLRAKSGDKFLLTNGKGYSATAEVVGLDKRNCTLFVGDMLFHAFKKPELKMMVCPTKNTDRFEWFLEKAVEIGVSEIIPVWSNRSERKVEKYDRWNKVLASALKQSQRFYLPKLHKAVKLNEAITSGVAGSNLLVAHCMPAINGKEHLLHTLKKDEDACIAIGPEGDFTEEEVKAMLENGAMEISLGDSRLRTETAAVVAVTYFSVVNSL